MNVFNYGLFLTVFSWPYTNFQTSLKNVIRSYRIRALDVIGGYPSFLMNIYACYNHSNSDCALNYLRRGITPFRTLSTVLDHSPFITGESDFIFRIAQSVNSTTTFLDCTKKQNEKQNFGEIAVRISRKYPNNYVYGDEIRTNGELSVLKPVLDEAGFCVQSYQQHIMFQINYTASCRWHFDMLEGCNTNNLVKFLFHQINSTAVCDRSGAECVIPILRDKATKSSNHKCDYYTTMRVRLATHQGSITGLLIELAPSSSTCRSDYCLLTSEITFHEVTQQHIIKGRMSSLSALCFLRYDNSEGRFRCPSEVTCLNELFYLLHILDPGAFSTQFLSLVLLFLSFLITCVFARC
ncbi:unnamed protein product [Thelazia callipaeda]|uniref:Tectonic domain-containing protein n=1 Tax=Thelazia callipaeda TaxID=103827 RepID=A0A0N5CWZ0_THECL|nr:unnamed protein product [Thelazia callipaeda]